LLTERPPVAARSTPQDVARSHHGADFTPTWASSWLATKPNVPAFSAERLDQLDADHWIACSSAAFADHLAVREDD
jgi:dTDP-4-amino-4,6-dideoxygalactose transaminase